MFSGNGETHIKVEQNKWINNRLYTESPNKPFPNGGKLPALKSHTVIMVLGV